MFPPPRLKRVSVCVSEAVGAVAMVLLRLDARSPAEFTHRFDRPAES